MIKEKQSTQELYASLDPGYLMLAVYVLGVTFLVFFAWLGGTNTALENEHQGQDRVVELMTEQPAAVTDHFMADKG
ncbi:MAG: hypothetical protein D3916_06320 [Candidatus Electrothrix sp. MAN1_4]|nr:hypothetical protein [Candidatus Electrothrix sp. MAN1_4]